MAMDQSVGYYEINGQAGTRESANLGGLLNG